MDITLSPGMKASLLSLKETSGAIDRTQERLSTGKKVNSSLDNPTNFFISTQLKNLADDLSQRHSVINESIKTIETAGNGVIGISRLLDSMRGVIDSARSTGDPAAKAQLAKTYDELYVQLNSIVGDSSYRGINLIGDNDPRLMSWDADDLPVSLNQNGSSSYTIEGEFLGAAYVLYEDGVPDVGWVPNQYGTKIAPVDAAATEFPEDIPGKLDFVFVIDTTGSMGGKLASVKANAVSFINSMEAAGVDGRYAFAAYGDINPAPVGSGDAAVRNALTFYSDAATFSAALAPLGLTGGGDVPESGLEGITTAAAGLPFRADATRRMLLLTDATVHTTADGFSTATIAGTVASLSASGIRLDIAVPAASAAQAQLTPLATATGGAVHNLNDPSFYTTGFGVTAPSSTTVPTQDLTIVSADYDNGEFSIFFEDPPPGATKAMSAEKGGLGIYHSWLYSGFQTPEGIDAATRDLEKAIATVRLQTERFGSGSGLLTTRDDFNNNIINISLEGADKLTLADMNEEGANMLMLQTRRDLGTTSLGLAAQESAGVLKILS